MSIELVFLIKVVFFIKIISAQTNFPEIVNLEKTWYSPNECGKNLSRMTRRCFHYLTFEQIENRIANRKLEYEEVRRLSVNFGNESESWWRLARPRIFGGNDTENGAFPWTARMTYQMPLGFGDNVCTGSVINEIFILTAAHCVHNKNISRMKWFVGVDPPIVGHLIETTIVEYWTHPCWRHPNSPEPKPENCIYPSYDYDVGLVLIENLTATTDGRWPLQNPTDENSYYKFNSICHHKDEWPIDMTEVYRVAGWGLMKAQTNNDTVGAQHLQWYRLILSPIDIFNKTRSIMVFHNKPGYAICGGDSGSPIVVQANDGTFFQRAVVFSVNEVGIYHKCAKNWLFAINIEQPEIRNWMWGIIERHIPRRN